MAEPRASLEPLVSSSQADQVLHRTLTSFTVAIQTMLSTLDGPTSALLHEASSILRIIRTYTAQAASIDMLLSLDDAVLAFFDAAHVVSAESAELEEVEWTEFKKLAKAVWDAIKSKRDWSSLVLKGIKDKVISPECRVAPDALLSAAEDGSLALPSILPSIEDALALLKPTSTVSVSPALAVVDPLVPQIPTGSSLPRSDHHAPTDPEGLTSLARALSSIIAYISRDRAFIRSEPGWLWLLSAYSLFAVDELAVPRASALVFGSNVAQDRLKSIVLECDGHRSYALSALTSSLESDWHLKTIGSIGGGKAKAAGGIVALLGDLVGAATEGDIYASRVLRDLVESILQYTSASAEDAEKWLMFGRTLQDKGKQVSVVRL